MSQLCLYHKGILYRMYGAYTAVVGSNSLGLDPDHDLNLV